MVLVNGAEGIGTGWSTNIPCYNPKDIINNIKSKLSGGKFVRMKPWYRNYKGKIAMQENNFLFTGDYQKNSKTLDIKELPIKKWTRDYKTFIEQLI